MKQNEILKAAVEEMDQLFQQLLDFLVECRKDSSKTRNLASALQSFAYLQADAAMACHIVGLLSPWFPELRDTPEGTARVLRADLAIRVIEDLVPTKGKKKQILSEDKKFRYPFLEDAVKFLEEKGVVTVAALASRSQQISESAENSLGLNDPETAKELNEALAESVRTGESYPDFRARMKGVLTLKRSTEETIYRTATKQAFVAGQESALDTPAVRAAFGYAQYVATHDHRVRDEHWEMDGFVCSIDDPAYRVMLALVKEWNCRCTIIPISNVQAERMTIKTIKDVPAYVRAHVRGL